MLSYNLFNLKALLTNGDMLLIEVGCLARDGIHLDPLRQGRFALLRK